MSSEPQRMTVPGWPVAFRPRLVLVLRGLPVPEVQYPVLDDRRRRAVWLDLAYPEHRIGIEYEALGRREARDGSERRCDKIEQRSLPSRTPGSAVRPDCDR